MVVECWQALQYNTIQNNTIQNNTIQNNTIQNNTIQYKYEYHYSGINPVGFQAIEPPCILITTHFSPPSIIHTILTLLTLRTPFNSSPLKAIPNTSHLHSKPIFNSSGSNSRNLLTFSTSTLKYPTTFLLTFTTHPSPPPTP